jgi:hypothetical protein
VKYSAARPSKEKAFAAATRKTSRVTPKIAGIESSANTASKKATITSAPNSGVAARRPLCRTTSA